jgi:hypothetical protein
MGFFSGRHGSLNYLGKPVARVRNWSLSANVELLDTTKIDQFAPTYRPGLKSATGSASLFYYRLEFRDKQANTSFSDLLQHVLKVGALDESDRVELELAVGNTTDDRLVIDAYLTRVTLGSQSGEVSTCDVDFTVTGDIKRGLS